MNAWSEDPELSFQEADSPLSGIPLTLGEKHLSNKAFSSPKAGEEGDFFPFVCTFTLKNYHIKRASSCSGGLTKL